MIKEYIPYGYRSWHQYNEHKRKLAKVLPPVILFACYAVASTIIYILEVI